jgi:hypothetical protein
MSVPREHHRCHDRWILCTDSAPASKGAFGTLKMTTAMAASLTGHRWTLAELVTEGEL